MKTIATAFIMLVFVSSAFSDSSMAKVVFRQVYPEVQSGTFSHKPKTVYKCGKNKGRMEEMADSSMKLHQLIIYNNGDSWMVNLFDSTGKYIKDSGPSFNFYATIFPVDSLMHFEFGREQEFLANRNVKKYNSKQNSDLMVRETLISNYIVILYTNTKTGKPTKVELYDKERRLQTGYEYLEYSTNLSPLDTLFQKPSGIAFDEKPNTEVINEDMLSYYTNNFYKNPHDTILLARLVKGIASSNMLQKETAIVPMIGFFCGAFSNNPDVDWKSIIESSNLNGRKVLLEALDCAKMGDSAFTRNISPTLNDFYWSKYFATGDSNSLVHIVGHLKFSNERRDPYLFLTAGSAKWSLASNAKQHERIRVFVQGQIKDQKGIVRKELKDLLEKSPGTIQQEMISIMKENKDNWKKNEQ